MNKVILNGIDVSEVIDKLEKVKNFIVYIKQAEQMHRKNGWKLFGEGLEKEAELHFGYAKCCQATINDLEMIIGEE